MCNDYRLEVETAKIFEDFADLKIKLRFSEGAPNIQAREDIKITDTAPIVRMIDGEPNAGDLVQRRWSWPGQNGRPVYNFRSDGREFNTGRCLIIADGFYEFTDPADKQKKVVILHRADWAGWLDPSVSAKSLIKPLPAGSLHVQQIG
jgi:putative SOS response-associated peptidase YedK